MILAILLLLFFEIQLSWWVWILVVLDGVHLFLDDFNKKDERNYTHLFSTNWALLIMFFDIMYSGTIASGSDKFFWIVIAPFIIIYGVEYYLNKKRKNAKDFIPETVSLLYSKMNQDRYN